MHYSVLKKVPGPTIGFQKHLPQQCEQLKVSPDTAKRPLWVKSLLVGNY